MQAKKGSGQVAHDPFPKSYQPVTQRATQRLPSGLRTLPGRQMQADLSALRENLKLCPTGKSALPVNQGRRSAHSPSRARQASPLNEVAAFDLEAGFIIKRGAVVKDGCRSCRRVGSGKPDEPTRVDTSYGLSGRGGGGKRRQDYFAQHACEERAM